MKTRKAKRVISVQYKDIPWFEWKYQVSSLWEIIRLSDRWQVKQKRLTIKCYRPREKPMVSLSENWKSKRFNVCDLIAWAFLKKPDWDWWYVKYKSSDKLDNRPDNLFYDKRWQWNVNRLTNIQENFIEWLMSGWNRNRKIKWSIRDKFDYWLININKC